MMLIVMIIGNNIENDLWGAVTATADGAIAAILPKQRRAEMEEQTGGQYRVCIWYISNAWDETDDTVHGGSISGDKCIDWKRAEAVCNPEVELKDRVKQSSAHAVV